MKSTHKVEKFDYSKFEKDPYWGSDVLKDYHFWGVHPKDNRFHIDTKRYKKMCKWIRIEEFMPEGMFLNRNSVYFVPAKIHRNDYKVNIFRDLLSELKEDWFNEYKPIFDLIKTPKQVEDETRTSEWMFTSCSDDCDEIDANATMAAIRRDSKYQEVIRSLYCQFITKVAVEMFKGFLDYLFLFRSEIRSFRIIALWKIVVFSFLDSEFSLSFGDVQGRNVNAIFIKDVLPDFIIGRLHLYLCRLQIIDDDSRLILDFSLGQQSYCVNEISSFPDSTFQRFSS